MKLRKEVKIIMVVLVLTGFVIWLSNKSYNNSVESCVNDGYTKKSCKTFVACLDTDNNACESYLQLTK